MNAVWMCVNNNRLAQMGALRERIWVLFCPPLFWRFWAVFGENRVKVQDKVKFLDEFDESMSQIAYAIMFVWAVQAFFGSITVD